MKYDQKLASLFYSNFKEAYRSAKLLNSSYLRMKSLMPLTINKFTTLTDEESDRLDAFRVRFYDLQDSLGSKTFRSILALEEERADTQLDVLNKIAKRRIINSFEEWKHLRDIRNLFSHDYPESDQERIDNLNVAYQGTLSLIANINNVITYMSQHRHLAMEDFTPF